jgi:hypothetical protein
MGATHKNWTLITNHGAVLLWLAENSRSTMREMSEGIGVTERQVARIVADLVDAQMLHVVRRGRSNVYSLNPEVHLRHPVLAHLPLQRLLEVLNVMSPAQRSGDLNQAAPQGARISDSRDFR